MCSQFTRKKVAIIGLGLIGGSLAKALKAYTQARVYGLDKDKEVERAALKEGAIDSLLSVETDLAQMDMTMVCLYPRESLSFVLKQKDRFQKESIVLDVCGIKQMIVDPIEALGEKTFYFVGGHPMAGKEKVGYKHSQAGLFQNASMIFTPLADTPKEVMAELKIFSSLLGFGRVVTTDPKHHDKVIALTSQLCHLTSSAFVQSPTAEAFEGYSAGSFQDLTRVAKLNPGMWAELFLLNREALLEETQGLIDRLEIYKKALVENDRPELEKLLSKGNKTKIRLLAKK